MSFPNYVPADYMAQQVYEITGKFGDEHDDVEFSLIPPKPTSDTVDMIEQNSWWLDINKQWHHIPEMDVFHAGNLVRWLERRAPAIQFKYSLAMIQFAPQGEMALEAFDQMMDELGEMDPLEWLRSKPLYQAVLARSQQRVTTASYPGLPSRLRAQ